MLLLRISCLDGNDDNDNVQLLLPFLRHCSCPLVGSRKMQQGDWSCSTANPDALVTKLLLTPRRNTGLSFFALYLADHGGVVAVIA